MSRTKVFVSAFLAGVCIAIGGTVYLSLDNKVLGALFFTMGLFTIWQGNLAGTFCTAQLERFTRIGASLSEKAIRAFPITLSMTSSIRL